MATKKPSDAHTIRGLEVRFQPWPSGHTTVNVVTVDYRGDRRIQHRIGACDLRMGPSHLVGLTPVECTWVLVSAFHEWLSEERASVPHRLSRYPSRAAGSAPPEGVMGESPERAWTQPFLPL